MFKKRQFVKKIVAITALLSVVAFFNDVTDLSTFLSNSNSENDVQSRSLQAASSNRKLSTDLGNGQCLWTEAQPLGKDANPYGTLIASYPASGMRVTWQHTEGITGIQVGDDFALGGEGAADKKGITKTQYPHLEGIWSWADHLDQVVLLVRNPRYAIPSYHNLIHEIGYAHDWEAAYDGLNKTFTERAPLSLWIKWRDYRIYDEIKLWSWHIDYWMTGGVRYWTEYDWERNGQWPFSFLNETEQSSWPIDDHCTIGYTGKNTPDMDCVAKELISFEHLNDDTSGPDELRKIANVIRGKEGMTVVGDDAVECIYHETIKNKQQPDNKDRAGPDASAYEFTRTQMNTMKDKVEEMKTKYSSGVWTNNPLAQRLVELFDEYLVDIESYINSIPPGAADEAMTQDYKQELVQWYRSLGRGSRYNKAKVQQLPFMWEKIKELYENGEEEDQTLYLG